MPVNKGSYSDTRVPSLWLVSHDYLGPYIIYPNVTSEGPEVAAPALTSKYPRMPDYTSFLAVFDLGVNIFEFQDINGMVVR